MAAADRWFVDNDIDQTGTYDLIPCLWEHFTAAYYLGDWGRVRDGYRRRLEHHGGKQDDVITRAALGAVAVRLGRPAEADRMDQWLARQPPRGPATFARARLALLRGDREGALRLLRRAYDEGHREPDHIDPDLEPLRGDSTYQELYRPRG